MNNEIRNIPCGVTVYCGSSGGNNPAFVEVACGVGKAIAEAGVPLIYGGGFMGMMGAVSKACRNAGGSTISIIPQFMVDRGWSDVDSSRTIVTPDMHERKSTMAAMAFGAIAMPGGVGTFEELTELITWRQLGLYSGNIVILNIAGYYDSLLQQFADAVNFGFLPSDHKQLWKVTDDPIEAVALALQQPSELKLNRKF